MRRFKILVVFTFLSMMLLVVLILSGHKPADKVASESITSSTTEKITFDLEAYKVHKKQQQELEIAVASYFKKAVKEGLIIGAGVSIVKGDSILLSNGFGKRSVETTTKVDGETVFRLGSLSKGFTAVLTAELKDEGKLNWQDKVSDYLPQFHLGDKENTDQVKLSHILSHTSGTPYHSFTNLVEAGITLEKIAARFSEVKPISEPGAMYSYQNAMFALTSEITKKVTGNDIGVSLSKRFFKPLGMYTASTNYETLIQNKNVAIPHSKSRRGWRSRKLNDHYDNAVAAGGINASALDMAKWMRFLLGHNPEVLNKSALSEVFEPRVDIKIGRKYYKKWPGHLASYYGFGWRIHKFMDETTNKQQTMWHHGGSVNSFRNEIAVYPDTDFGICVLLNSNSPIARNVIPDLHKIVESIYNKPVQKLAEPQLETAVNSFE
ncbi:beta-lactamase family protein [Aurantibacter crassamenti]|uniref:serine hydrolase domain-containing protein n=1 Tax=Aurantibacter crassamenti TaxID=1837375 RepID=UPI00193A28A2|nr:serine hydrolase domain-containing protein [Aurantibacter crassamenti]MBM1107589.1 beta-lactamase family protein [Aurantibacter crassamenti]